MSTIEETHSARSATSVGREADEVSSPRRRRLRLLWPALGALVVGAGAGAWLWIANGSTESSSDRAGPVATARVERGTISATETWDATLGHGAPFTVKAGADGTVTRLLDQGESVERGDALYRVDERPVIMLYGGVPMYRELAPGAAGRDVEQLESNLVALGYDGLTADGVYDELTGAAVRAWQAEIGGEPAGTVARGDVVFVPEAGRVEALHVGAGDVLAPGAPIVDITGTDEVVSLEVDVDDRARFDVGAAVTVELPTAGQVAGTVSSTAVREFPAEGADGGGTTDSAILEVEVAVNEDVPDELVGAPVEVVVAIDERADVLVVPVNALLALAEGGYGLEVVGDDGTTEIVTVDTGLFADGKVEVSGAGLAEGVVVGVAGR